MCRYSRNWIFSGIRSEFSVKSCHSLWCVRSARSFLLAALCLYLVAVWREHTSKSGAAPRWAPQPRRVTRQCGTCTGAWTCTARVRRSPDALRRNMDRVVVEVPINNGETRLQTRLWRPVNVSCAALRLSGAVCACSAYCDAFRAATGLRALQAPSGSVWSVAAGREESGLLPSVKQNSQAPPLGFSTHTCSNTINTQG